jgi:cell division septation protein DedD
MDALATFADLRARYSDVLSTSIPEVQAADLSSRGLGTMYRVVVGPPGSREAANSLCTKLKTAGYSSCWVKSY